MKHSIPSRRTKTAFAGRAISFESDVRLRVVIYNGLQVGARQIGFVGAHFIHNKVTSGRVNQGFELRVIGSEPFRDLQGRNPLRCGAADAQDI